MTTKAEIIKARYASLAIPPILLKYDLPVSASTNLRCEIIGHFGPGTADKMERLFKEIVAITRELEHPPIDDIDPSGDTQP